MPDLLVTWYDPRVRDLAPADPLSTVILGYLRLAGRARLETISQRIGQTNDRVSHCLKALTNARIVSQDGTLFSVRQQWRRILSQVVSIEAKVTDWQKAAAQAARNRIFAHRSFVALPRATALRVRKEAPFRKLGLGLLSVDANDGVAIVRNAPLRQPRVWAYYYQIALVVAQYSGGGNNALHSATKRGRS